jgi:hypothetical protein
MMSSQGDGADHFERAWETVERNWADGAVHRQFIAFCRAEQALAEAGRRYREVRDRDPSRREQASAQLSAVLAAALVSLDEQRPRRVARRSKSFWMVCGVGAALFGYALLTVLRLLAR